MRRLPIGLLSFALGVALLVPGVGQAQSSPAKRALIVELIELSGGSRMVEQITESVLVSFKQNQSALVENLIATQPQLSEAERTELRLALAQQDRISARFAAELPRRLEFDKIVDTVYVPLYDKHFSEEELRAIVAFYRTPAGSKAIQVMPVLLQESMQETAPIIQPIVMDLIDEILRDEQARALE